MEVKTFPSRTKKIDTAKKGAKTMDYRAKNEQIREEFDLIRGKLAQAKYLIREIDHCDSHVVNGDWKYDRVPRSLIKALYYYLWKDVDTCEYYCSGSAEENRSSDTK